MKGYFFGNIFLFEGNIENCRILFVDLHVKFWLEYVYLLLGGVFATCLCQVLDVVFASCLCQMLLLPVLLSI